MLGRITSLCHAAHHFLCDCHPCAVRRCCGDRRPCGDSGAGGWARGGAVDERPPRAD
eukprot:gene9735-8387_t